LLAARVFQPGRRRQMLGRLAEINRLVEETADTLGIAELLERKPAALSGGQQQRAAVGRALVRRPKVFLFDEPLSNLDAVLRVELRRELRRLHGRLHATMIYVTHDQTEAMTLGTRIAVMDGGRIRQLGEPLAIYDRPVDRFVAGFIGSPPMNFLAGVLRQEDQYLVLHGESAVRLGPLPAREGLADGRSVVLGIRPEHVCLTAPPSRTVAIRGTVGLVEPLGYETIVHVAFGEATLSAKAAPHDAPEPGTAVTTHLLADRIHWFDAEKGSRI
jgi:multiple sugar transport system ATP-binding protein